MKRKGAKRSSFDFEKLAALCQSRKVVQAVSTPTAKVEPTKAVQANLPLSLYNRMKRRKFETDESFQSIFQRAMELFLDVEEGKAVISDNV
jgi:hypothetical protein